MRIAFCSGLTCAVSAAATICILAATAGFASQAHPVSDLKSSLAINVIPGMPPVLDPHNLYSANGPNLLASTVKNYPQRVYVPNSKSDTVDIIDPQTYKI